MPPYGAYRFTRIAGPTPDAPDVYAPIQEGWISPRRFQNTGRPIWKPLDGTVYAKGTAYSEEIRAFPAKNDPAVLVLDREFETQSVDPMFLEPECGLAWYNTDRKILELVLGVQSPYEAATAIAFLLGKAREPFKPSAVNAQFAYVGGGFGGRDHTPLPLYVALAGDVFSPGARCGSHTTATNVPGRHQAARVQNSHLDRRRPGQRPDAGLCCRPCPRRRRPRQLFGRRGARRRHCRARHL
jgi:hypothetical protein